MLILGKPALANEEFCRNLRNGKACREGSSLILKAFLQASEHTVHIGPRKTSTQRPNVEDGTGRVLPFEAMVRHKVSLPLETDPDGRRSKTGLHGVGIKVPQECEVELEIGRRDVVLFVRGDLHRHVQCCIVSGVVYEELIERWLVYGGSRRG